MCLCSGDVGGHVVFVLVVTTSREPISVDSQLASSKSVLSIGDFCELFEAFIFSHQLP